MTSSSPESFDRRFVFLLVAQAGFGFSHSSFMMLPKFLATQLAAGPAEIGAVVAASAISMVVFLVPAGSLVDRHGRKRFLVGGAALMAVSSAAYVAIDAIGPALYALRIVQSIAFAAAWTAGAALCVDAAPPRRVGQAIGLFGLAYVFMGAFAPATVEAVVAASGWDVAFVIAACAAAFCAGLSLFVREAPLDRASTPHVPLGSILRREEMFVAILVIGLLGVAYGCVVNFHQPYALRLGIRELRIFFIANACTAAAARLILGPWLDRIGLRRVALASLALYTLVVLSMAWLDRLGLLVIGLGLGLAHGLFYPAWSGVVLEDCPPAERGRRMALVQAGLNVGIGLGGLALGHVAAEHGYPPIFALAASGLVLAGLLVAREAARARRRIEAVAAGGGL